MNATLLETEEALINLKPRPSKLQIKAQSMVKKVQRKTLRITRPLCVLTIYYLIDNFLVLGLLGTLNRLFGFIDSIFLCYSAGPKYTRHFCHEFTDELYKWNPPLVGIFFQDGKMGITYATPMLESEFMKHENHHKLAKVLKKIERVKNILGVKKVNLSGILPSYLTSKGIKVDGLKTSERLGKIVLAAANNLRKEYTFDFTDPTIILGGKGVIGNSIVEELQRKNKPYFVVDQFNTLKDIPLKYRNKRAILIDVSRKGVLEKQKDDLWEEVIVLNETYPEPNKQLINDFKNKKIKAFHISGMKARAFPRFPGAYHKGIPCCASQTVKVSDIQTIKLS